jgi:16S rRNA (cytidine1402-2'-O)-methyltransferase
LLAYHEHNERYAGKRILDMLDSGMTVALCSDGGTPCVSDPGYRLVTECVAAGHRVEVLPGPSAVLTALLGSGLSTSSFTFKGFPPRKSGARRRFLEADLDQPHTLVVYESPFRVGKLLDDAVAVYGNRLAAVCLELTKIHEQFHRGYLADLAAQFRDLKVKGEVTVVIAGNNPKFEREEPDDESDDDSE